MKLFFACFLSFVSVQLQAATWHASTLGDFEVSVETSDLRSGIGRISSNQVKLRFRSTEGDEIESVELSPETFVPFMPSMGHGTPTRHEVTLNYQGEAGFVLVDHIYFVMASMGHHGWVLRLDPAINGLSAHFEVPIHVGG